MLRLRGVYVIELVHSFDAAHRVVGHDGGRGKCARLHGHTYTATVECGRESLNETGFVVDFAVIKALIDEWDHRTVLWEDDPLFVVDDDDIDEYMIGPEHAGVVRVPFNPTSENMSRHLAEALMTAGSLAWCTVTLSETPKSSATWTAYSWAEAA